MISYRFRIEKLPFTGMPANVSVASAYGSQMIDTTYAPFYLTEERHAYLR